MARTVQDYADAVTIGPIAPSGDGRDRTVDIQQVEARGPHVVATMLWGEYEHPVSHALLPDDVLLWGGDLPIEEATLDHWAEEAMAEFAWAAGSPLMSSRRTWTGHVIELAEAEPIEPRYSVGHVRGLASPSDWHEIAHFAEPRVPPKTVERWKLDGSLISWHYVSLEYGRVLPVYGHGAARWVDEGVASFDYLELLPGLPETFGVMTLAEAILSAAAEGARKITTSVDVPGVELLGFRDVGGRLEVDNRFLDLDYEGLAAFVSRTSGWTPSRSVQADIRRINEQRYFAH